MLALVVLKLVIVGRTHSPQIDHQTKRKKKASLLTNKNEEEIKITQQSRARESYATTCDGLKQRAMWM